MSDLKEPNVYAALVKLDNIFKDDTGEISLKADEENPDVLIIPDGQITGGVSADKLKTVLWTG
ncbi:hypothetical protein [Bacillus massiliglaciei]|uniref:hypothetical protein n=1 Tax=Bacillus massiliglaciei TaxID=1816693 RepID=UPI000DA6084B|nr:hypothetical protein [Bacillus massiliglaciei]